MITRPTCPTSASTPHAGEHETLVAHAAHLIAELEPALPVYAGELEPEPARATRPTWTPSLEPAQLDVGEHDHEPGARPLDTS
jgi:hypothetical protein